MLGKDCKTPLIEKRNYLCNEALDALYERPRDYGTPDPLRRIQRDESDACGKQDQ
jgi:hypothetical protein